MDDAEDPRDRRIEALQEELSYLRALVRQQNVRSENIADQVKFSVAMQTVELERVIEELKSSTSWRITAPLRTLGRLKLKFNKKEVHLPVPQPADHRPVIVPDSKNFAFEVIGHANGFYSLAAINRSVVTALSKHSNHVVAFRPYEAGPSRFQDFDASDSALVARAASTAIDHTSAKVAIVQHYPLHVPNSPYDLLALYFFWEESRIPSDMVRSINRHFDLFLAPTHFVAKAAIDSGVSIPVRHVRAPNDFKAFRSIGLRRDRGKRDRVNFLHVSSCFTRKGVDVLIRAFRKAFSAEDPVQLLIKGYPNPHNDVPRLLGGGGAAGGTIHYLDTPLSNSHLLKLYEDSDVMVLPSRGEGLNLPAAEAIAAGMRLIVTAEGGHADFISDSFASLIDFSFDHARSHFSRMDSVWFEPDETMLIKCLQDQAAAVLANAPVEDGWPSVANFFEPTTFTQDLERIVCDSLSREKVSRTHLVMVSTYDVECGIAEYSRLLVRALSQAGGLKIDIACDDRTKPHEAQDGIRVLPLWERSLGADALASLIQKLGQLKPDVVFVQYHPSFYSVQALLQLMTHAREQGWRSIVTFHNLRYFATRGGSELTDALALFDTIDRIFVHTVYDLNLLKSFGFTRNVTLVPQGVEVAQTPPRRHFEFVSDRPLVGSYGFALPHKGIDVLIQSFSKLKASLPLARLRLVNSDYGAHPAAIKEINRCKALAADLGLTESIDWHTDFLPHDQSLLLLSQCDVLVFPYQDTSESSSAAARAALASRRPVAVTPIAIFEDLRDAVFRFESTRSDAISDGIEQLLSDPALRRRILDQSDNWLEQHRWEEIGERVRGIVAGLRNS